MIFLPHKSCIGDSSIVFWRVLALCNIEFKPSSFDGYYLSLIGFFSLLFAGNFEKKSCCSYISFCPLFVVGCGKRFSFSNFLISFFPPKFNVCVLKIATSWNSPLWTLKLIINTRCRVISFCYRIKIFVARKQRRYKYVIVSEFEKSVKTGRSTRAWVSIHVLQMDLAASL